MQLVDKILKMEGNLYENILKYVPRELQSEAIRNIFWQPEAYVQLVKAGTEKVIDKTGLPEKEAERIARATFESFAGYNRR